MRRPAVIVALGVMAALTLGAADGGPRAAAPSGGTLRLVLPSSSALPTLDPALNAPTLGWGALWYATCATLMAFRDAEGPEGYVVRPEAAVGLPEVSRDRLTYVFTIRKGLRFNDGTPVTAANFARGLGRVLNSAMRSEGAFLFSDVRRVARKGPRRLLIQLSRPSGDLLTRLALAYACPVPLGFPVDPAGVRLMVGSGPYYVARYDADRTLVLERNPYYRGTRPHHVERVVITFSGDFDANIEDVEEERADGLPADIPFEARDRLERRYGVNRGRLLRIRGTFVYFVALNTSRPLFRGNVALRKAINFALNRDEIVKAGPGWPLSHVPTDNVLPDWLPGRVDRQIYPLARPNLSRARSLAGGNLRGGKAVLYTSQIPFLVDQAKVIARHLREIGLEVDVTPLAPAVIDARAGTPGAPYDMVLTRYLVQYPDPSDVMVRLLAGENARRSAGNTNFAYFDDPGFNRRMYAAGQLSGPARVRAFSELDAEMMRDAAPWAPLYGGSSWFFVSSRVGCVKLHPVFRLDMAGICLE